MITGSVLLSPMNTYFKLLGKGFNFNSGAYKIDGKNFLSKSTKSIKTLPWETVYKACKANANLCTFWGTHMCLSIFSISVNHSHSLKPRLIRPHNQKLVAHTYQFGYNI
jgi:hypothetical protein